MERAWQIGHQQLGEEHPVTLKAMDFNKHSVVKLSPGNQGVFQLLKEETRRRSQEKIGTPMDRLLYCRKLG